VLLEPELGGGHVPRQVQSGAVALYQSHAPLIINFDHLLA